MSDAEIRTLLVSLREAHATLKETVVNFDLEQVMHPDSGWLGRDMLSHIGAWDREIAMALHGYRIGVTYLIPDFEEDAYNLQSAVNQRDLSTEQVLIDWGLARQLLIEAVEMMPPENFSGAFRYPWADEQGSVTTLVQYFTEHDLEHKEEFESFQRESA